MIQKLQKMRAEKGFTLAELLVVILIIAILATLAIVFFSGQEGNAQTAVDKGNVRSAYSSAQAYYVEEGGSYPGADDAAKTSALVAAMIEDGVEAISTGSPTGGKVLVAVTGSTVSVTAGSCVGSNSTGPFLVNC